MTSAFERACREADVRKSRGEQPRSIDPSLWQKPDNIPDNWPERLIETLLAHFNRARPTARVVVEAIMVAVRERGLAALKEPATKERLARCDVAARAEINKQIQKLGGIKS